MNTYHTLGAEERTSDKFAYARQIRIDNHLNFAQQFTYIVWSHQFIVILYVKHLLLLFYLYLYVDMIGCDCNCSCEMRSAHKLIMDNNSDR
jgi:hypothetical protein